MERSSEIFQIHGVSTILTQKKIEYVTIKAIFGQKVIRVTKPISLRAQSWCKIKFFLLNYKEMYSNKWEESLTRSWQINLTDAPKLVG